LLLITIDPKKRVGERERDNLLTSPFFIGRVFRSVGWSTATPGRGGPSLSSSGIRDKHSPGNFLRAPWPWARGERTCERSTTRPQPCDALVGSTNRPPEGTCAVCDRVLCCCHRVALVPHHLAESHVRARAVPHKHGMGVHIIYRENEPLHRRAVPACPLHISPRFLRT
jgi:hypothetical protein